jgi:hypothetical protein
MDTDHIREERPGLRSRSVRRFLVIFAGSPQSRSLRNPNRDARLSSYKKGGTNGRTDAPPRRCDLSGDPF